MADAVPTLWENLNRRVVASGHLRGDQLEFARPCLGKQREIMTFIAAP